MRNEDCYYGIDIFKLIFALAVVAIHVDPLVCIKGSIIYKMYRSLILLGCAIFLYNNRIPNGSKIEQGRWL